MIKWDGIFSLLIFIIEFALLVNVIIFAQKNHINFLTKIIILLLALYQTIEFSICSLGFNNSFIIYIAFVVISFLPPLNLLFTLNYFHYRNKKLNLIFVPSIFFTIFYAFSINKFYVESCGVFYAAYNYPLGFLYGFFYYVPILISIYLFAVNIKKRTENLYKIIMKVVLSGLLFIFIPVVIAFVLAIFDQYGLLNKIESIMCKFAFVYAVCLSFFSLNYKVK